MKRNLTCLCSILGILSIKSLDLMEERNTNETLLTTGCDHLMKLMIVLSKNNADVLNARGTRRAMHERNTSDRKGRTIDLMVMTVMIPYNKNTLTL